MKYTITKMPPFLTLVGAYVNACGHMCAQVASLVKVLAFLDPLSFHMCTLDADAHAQVQDHVTTYVREVSFSSSVH